MSLFENPYFFKIILFLAIIFTLLLVFISVRYSTRNCILLFDRYRYRWGFQSQRQQRRRGNREHAVVSFPIPNLDSMKTPPEMRTAPCVICLEPFEKSFISTGFCNHSFHTNCITSWLSKDPQASCPVCRVFFFSKRSPCTHEHDHTSEHTHTDDFAKV